MATSITAGGWAFLDLHLPGDHEFHHMFTNPFFRLQDAGYEGGRAQLDGLYNGRRYGVHQYISMYSMRNMNRDEHFLSQVIVQPMADQIVAGVEAVRRESLIRGHTHNTATYLDEALRMPDNMS